MGMFDDLICEAPLPDGYSGDFQTKDLDCTLDALKITAAGELLRKRWLPDSEEPVWEPLNFHGRLNFYGYDKRGLPPTAPHDRTRWHEYEAKFTDGKLVEIELVNRK